MRARCRLLTGCGILLLAASGFLLQHERIDHPVASEKSLANRRLAKESARGSRDARAPRSPDRSSRAPSEWQGMQFDVADASECRVEHSCGLALACIEERCGPCVRDDQCENGEACVLDHCLLRSNVHCRRASDCPNDDLCILTGISDDPRGNGDMNAICSAQYVAKGTERDPQTQRRPLPPLHRELLSDEGLE